MELIGAALKRMRSESLSIPETAARVIQEVRSQKKRLPGLGHRVHSTDPRVAVLFQMARQAGLRTEGVELMEAMEQAAAAQIKPLPINIDGGLAAVLFDLGFPPAAGKLIFIVGRVAGLTAEVAEEYAREKPMRIRIPVEYDGELPRAID
jgi:citrate synthase